MVIAVVAIPHVRDFFGNLCSSEIYFPTDYAGYDCDFKACGGFLLLATGFRIAKIHDFPVADMIPAMVLVMPVSWFWVNVIVPLL